MCGGRGTRLDRGEKPLFEVGGEPMVDRVLDALGASRVETVHAVTSPHTPETTAHLDGRTPVLETEGDGYVADLSAAVDRLEPPVLTVVADLPLLSGDLVDRTLAAHDAGALTVCVPTALKRVLGVSADTTRAHGGRELSPTGLNVVGGDTESDIVDRQDESDGVGRQDESDGVGQQDESDDDRDGETLRVSYDARLAVNVNRPGDATVAEELADGP